MLGAIIGDIVGSPYEFTENNIKTTEFPLFSEQSRFTDDTVMTVAVAESVMLGYGNAEATKKALIATMHKYGQMFPFAGYGQRFFIWLAQNETAPYNSHGNGSAMRVSPVAWAYDTLADVEHYAQISAEVTHNHPEGIKGASATAAAIFLARTGSTQEQIKIYIQERFGYNLMRTLDDIRPKYTHIESCQGSVPEAITAFLESYSFEDALRKAVSLGGDSDTIAAIAGSIAEAFYGSVPSNIQQDALVRLDNRLLAIVKKWDHWINNH
ncbi:ADP-ribosylglycohydrolase family protein [Salmonella enterica]|nr:ADP-ribosylglycohydrolase family protein [Salmonella enterica]ECE1533576.1 ADP-ribosylglycohydrolase family protein [Salmonella enterica]EFT8082099.1 ADP-ribosylglycohydrolase family protein [Salmonella enterica]EFT8114814.1 ADP-ribosylglycohydrolase family protein [Salmonella enterica]EKC6454653.1 ADP-ribosylglycohydrolase family protein [Salmonella enterica]